MTLILIGFMSSGKSSVAKQLSPLLGYSLVEMDELVLQKTGAQNMQEVFAQGGELLLRETEIALAKEYASKTDLVVSTGGGVVHNKIVLDYFKAAGGKVLFLNTHFDLIAKRLENDCSRPLFQSLKHAKELYELRLPLYRSYADVIIDTVALSASEIARLINETIHEGALLNGL
jgi:shikimate kinase